MFSEALSRHSAGPYHLGRPDRTDSSGTSGTPGAGPFMTMHLCMRHDTISEAWFETYGCPTAVGCGSWTAHWAEGRTVAEARILEPQDLRTVLGGLPLGKEHCADLAVGSLRSALDAWESAEQGAENRSKKNFCDSDETGKTAV